MTSPSKIVTMKEKEKNRTSYFREVQKEIKKISWVSKKDLFMLTKVVLGATLICGFGIYLADITLQNALQAIYKIAHLVIG